MGRREASALRKSAPRARKARVVTTRLSAFRFPFVCGLGGHRETQEIAQAEKPSEQHGGTEDSRANKKTRRKNGRTRHCERSEAIQSGLR